MKNDYKEIQAIINVFRTLEEIQYSRVADRLQFLLDATRFEHDLNDPHEYMSTASVVHFLEFMQLDPFLKDFPVPQLTCAFGRLFLCWVNYDANIWNKKHTVNLVISEDGSLSLHAWAGRIADDDVMVKRVYAHNEKEQCMDQIEECINGVDIPHSEWNNYAKN